MRMWNRMPLCVVVCCAAAAVPAETPRPYVFGMNINTSDRDLALAKAAGCTSARIGAGWDLVERVEGVYDWRDPDRDVERCLAHGIEPFFLIVATPPWALAPAKRDKPWGHAPEPEFLPHAERFYRMLAARYRGRVKYYEFWNEWNGYGWHEPGHTDEYAPLLKLAYRALKEGDPDCLVAVGGIDGAGWKGYHTNIERLYELGCGDSFDAVAIHPYRWDGPIDLPGMRKVREVLERHGHGERLFWLTEYGWSNEYGHDNKARWLKETLDLLTHPDQWYVFQASIHTLRDFDDTEYGLCDRNGHPRAAYQVFRDYPKDWETLASLHRTPTPTSAVELPDGSFEEGPLAWTAFGDGAEIVEAEALGLHAESGKRVLAADGRERPRNGGVWRQFEAPRDRPLRLEARVYTDQHGGRADNARGVLGLDPTGGTDPEAGTVIWGRPRDTSGQWDSLGVGLGEPILPQADRVTAFLRVIHRPEKAGQLTAFDDVRLSSRPDTFALPEVRPVPTPLSQEHAQTTVDRTPAPTAAMPAQDVLYVWPDGGAFTGAAGNWSATGEGWLAAKADGDRRMFLFCSAPVPLPDENWIIEADVFAEQALNVGLWAGEDADHCVMGIVAADNRPFTVWCLTRDGPGPQGFRERKNEDIVPVEGGRVHRVAISRHGAAVNLWLDGKYASSYPAYTGPMRRFGLYVLSPEAGQFVNIRLLRGK